jgi:hypothetical protein
MDQPATSPLISRKRRVCAVLFQHVFAVAFVLAIVVAIVSVIGYATAIPPQIPIVFPDSAQALNAEPVLGNQTNNLFWFSQVTDLHISSFYPHPETAFRHFCNQTMAVVQPAFVIASGDITDGFIDSTSLRPGQVEVRPVIFP